MVGNDENEVCIILKWCSGGGEIGYYVKIGGYYFVERE